jgi:hypothetical protein
VTKAASTATKFVSVPTAVSAAVSVAVSAAAEATAVATAVTTTEATAVARERSASHAYHIDRNQFEICK